MADKADIAVFRDNMEKSIERYARTFLVELVGESRARQATARLGLAMRQVAMQNAAQTEKGKPTIYDAGEAAIANAVAMCALTDLMPGGQHAECWIFPKGGSAGGLSWMMSHRGVIKLARRAGWEVRPMLVDRAGEDQTEEFADEWLYERNPFPVVRHVPHQTQPSWATIARSYVYFWPIGQRDDVDLYVLERSEIEARRNVQGSGPVWSKWPREMAMKATIKSAAARGLFPLDYESNLALKVDDDNERENVIDVVGTSRPAPAPERTSTPPRKTLADVLGPDEDDDTDNDQGRTPEPVVAQQEAPKAPRTRKPKVVEETPPADSDKLNAQNELLLRVQEAERHVNGNILAARTAHGIAPTLTAGQIVKQLPEAAVISYCRELEA